MPGVFVGELEDMTQFEPFNTLFVSPSWPAGSDPNHFFTDPSVALAFAITLNPTPTNPVAVIFYPGIYPQNLTLVSNVHLFGHSIKGTELSGNLTYTPGAGVNAPQVNLNERVYMGRLRVTGNVVYDATGKTNIGQTSTLDTRNVDLRGDLTASGRNTPGSADFFQTWDGVHGGTTWTLDAIVANFNNGVTLGANNVTLSNCLQGAEFAGCLCFSALHLINTPGAGGPGNTFAAVTVDAASVFGPIPGSKTGVVTVAAGGKADLRNAEWFQNANLVGPGAIDRSIWRTAVDTALGANLIFLTPPYIDANYNVAVTQTSGPGGVITVDTKAASTFLLHDSVGGNRFELTVLKE